jgi:IclR family KDG regulon transcriptional repressor
MPKISGQQEEGVQSVVLALKLVEFLTAAGKPMGVTAIAQALGTTKSRIYRHLQTMVYHHYLLQEPELERYMIGPRLVALGRGMSGNLNLAAIAAPILHEMRDSLGHSCVVAQIADDGILVIETVSGKSPIEIGVKFGSLLKFHTSAQGKVALAFGPPALRHRVLAQRLEMLTPHTMVSPTVLQNELNLIEAQGWGTAPNEALIGLNALAAPIFMAGGRCIGTIAIVDSIQFIEAVPSDDQISRIVDAAARISALMGFEKAHQD